MVHLKDNDERSMNRLYNYCKNTVSKVAAISMMAATLSSCADVIGSSYEVDWAPVVMDFFVRDQYGNDLLNPEYPDNIIEGSTITFQGIKYSASTEMYNQYIRDEVADVPQTKAYLPRMDGFVLMNGEMTGNGNVSGFFMRFGEIDGAADMDEILSIRWADGTRDEIRYVCSNHKEGRNPTCNRSYYLNGEKVNSPRFILTH